MASADGGAADASIMDGADACATPDAIRAPLLWIARTPSRRDDDTTLPRMTGDAGLLISTTTSESDHAAVT